MINNLSNPLEELEQIPKQVLGGLIKLPGSIVKQAMGIKIDPLTGLEIPSQKKLQQLQKRERKQRQSGLAMMRQSIDAAKSQGNNATKSDVSQLPAYIAGKPGFSQDKMQKRMQGLETEKHDLPPPIAAVKSKFSTGERKHGPGG
mgnify:CR=1 FL=1